MDSASKRVWLRFGSYLLWFHDIFNQELARLTSMNAQGSHLGLYKVSQVTLLEYHRSVPFRKLPPQTIHRDTPVDLNELYYDSSCGTRYPPVQVRHSTLRFHSKVNPNHLLRYANGEPFENVSQSTPRLLYPASSPSPLPLHSSWHMLPEMESFPDTSTPGPQNTVQPAYTNPGHDFARHGDYYYDRELLPPSRGYEPRALERPLDPSFASSQFAIPRGMVGQLPPRAAPRPIMYTDDAGLKLCDRIRRQCFNCKATTTTTWRRSMLNQGKLVRFMMKSSK